MGAVKEEISCWKTVAAARSEEIQTRAMNAKKKAVLDEITLIQSIDYLSQGTKKSRTMMLFKQLDELNQENQKKT